MVTDDARSVSTWNREKGSPLTELERAIQLTMNWTVIVVMLVCHAQYVGSTTTKFRLRFNNHKARFRAHSRLSFEGRNKDDLLYRHFSYRYLETESLYSWIF